MTPLGDGDITSFIFGFAFVVLAGTAITLLLAGWIKRRHEKLIMRHWSTRR